MDYTILHQQLASLAREERRYVPLLSNAAALLYHSLPHLNWAGFYLVRRDELLLGPFQGNMACIRIAPGKGVCGAAWQQNATQRVDDVHAFPGHIACDSASNAEIVVPVHKNGEVVAVLDIDSPAFNRFTDEDRAGLEAFVRVLERTMEMD